MNDYQPVNTPSDLGNAPLAPPPPGKGPSAAPAMMSELKVSGHLMALEAGLYCVTHAPSGGANAATGLPGVRISSPPQPAGQPDEVAIASFRPDGYLHPTGDAALVRVLAPSAQVLVTIYQSANAGGPAPNIQVRRLVEAPGSSGASAGTEAGSRPAPSANGDRDAGRSPAVMEMVAHIQERADVGAMLGDWLGERGSKRWIEGFGVMPHGLSPADIEYQAVLGRGWLSPWVEGGQFCGSRGMALPVLGIRVRLRGAFAETHEVSYSAAFLDGAEAGPASDGEPCESDGLAPMEAFRIVLRPRGEAELEPEAARPATPVVSEAATPQLGKSKRVKVEEPAGKGKKDKPRKS